MTNNIKNIIHQYRKKLGFGRSTDPCGTLVVRGEMLKVIFPADQEEPADHGPHIAFQSGSVFQPLRSVPACLQALINHTQPAISALHH